MKPVPSRSASLAAIACCAAALLACASPPALRSCTTSEECPATARCISNACVANAPPSILLEVPATPFVTNLLVSLDASASSDPDAGDSIVSFSWAFRALSGATCAVPVAAGTGPSATVRFACPGRYAVDVTATDEMGASSTATRELGVATYLGPALVTAGDDVAVDHVCTAVPSCATRQPVALSASAPGLPAEQVSFTWSVVPPSDRPLSASRRVTFSPGASVASPVVAIETDGEAISGEWIFTVSASDSAGLIGTAATRVSVGNHPPTVTKTIPVPDHAFDGSQFTSNGEVPFTVSDEDGDPLLAPEIEWRHSGDGASTFVGNPLQDPTRASFIIRVPYATPADATRLIGGAGLERTIVFAVSDVNGARVVEHWPIVVGNRPPVLVSQPATFSIDHSYDPIGLAYVADVPLSTWSDPDGDPLSQAAGSGTGDPACPDLVVDGVAHTLCRLPFTGAPAVANLAGTHTIAQAVQDPWAPSAATSTVTFTILNRPPAITSTATFVETNCSMSDSCCRIVEGYCDVNSATTSGTIQIPSRWADPDGDPISLTVDAAGSYTPVQPLTCVPDACVLDVSIVPTSVCGTSTVTYLPTSLSDGLATATGTLPIQARCY